MEHIQESSIHLKKDCNILVAECVYAGYNFREKQVSYCIDPKLWAAIVVQKECSHIMKSCHFDTKEGNCTCIKTGHSNMIAN